MTSIDLALMGPVPAKQGASNGKIIEKSGDEQGSKGRDAFESIFAAAGRKKGERTKEGDSETSGNATPDAKTQAASFRLAGRFDQKSAADTAMPKDAVSQEAAAVPEDTGTSELDTHEDSRSPKGGSSSLKAFDLKSAFRMIRQDENQQTDPVPQDAGAEISSGELTQLMQLLAAAQEQKSDGQTAPVDAKAAAASLQEVLPRQMKNEPKRETGMAVARFNDANDSAAVLMTDTAETETDTLFRFAREDGKGRQLDLKVSTVGRRSAEMEDAPAAKIENVTVLESRRYLGLAANSNASNLTTAISTNSSWTAAMQPGSPLFTAAENPATGKVVNTLKLQMQPVDLGSVTATLRLTGDQLNVDIRVETGEAYRQLNDDQKGILKALKAQGFAVEQINVVLVQPDQSTAASQSTGNQNQQHFGQPDRNGGGGPQQGQGQQNDGRQAAANEGRLQRDDAADEPAGGIGAGRPEHVYL